SADWTPDPSWPQAPPGWQFWLSDEPEDDVVTYAESPAEADTPDRPPRRWWHRSKGTIAGIVAFNAVVAIGLVVLFMVPRPLTRRTMPETHDLPPTVNDSAPTGADPGWRDPGWGTTPLYIDFAAWTRFGGIDATVSDGGKTVRLDTHDTTDTWRTKWSG